MSLFAEKIDEAVEQFEHILNVQQQRSEIWYKYLEASSRMLASRLQYSLWCVAIAAPAFFALNSNFDTLTKHSILPFAEWIHRVAIATLITSIITAVIIYYLVNRWLSRLEKIRMVSLRNDEAGLRVLQEFRTIAQDVHHGKKTPEVLPTLHRNDTEVEEYRDHPYTGKVLYPLSTAQLVLVVIGYILTAALVTTIS